MGEVVKRYKLPVIKEISPRAILYSIELIRL